MNRGSILTLLLILMVSSWSKAAAFTVFDPTNYAQNLLTASRSLQQVEQQATQLINEAQVLVNMANNLKTLDAGFLSTLQGKINNIKSLIDQANSIAKSVGQMESFLKENYPTDYENLSYDNNVKTARNRWETRINTFTESMGIQSGALENVEQSRAALTELENRSRQAVGNLEVTQISNEMLALIAKQLFTLQELEAMHGRADVLDRAERADKEGRSRQEFNRFFQRKVNE